MSMTRLLPRSWSPARKGAALLFSLACLSSLLTWVVYHSIDPIWRLGQGRLVPISSTIAWKSPPIRDTAQRLRAGGEFRLVNRGGGVVRVISVESGCGCTVPSISTDSVKPGEVATISVSGIPLSSGERTAIITVRTDSRVSPEISLQFKMIVDRAPPFVMGVSGDFAYLDESALQEPRDFVVTAVEDGPTAALPHVESDLSFLRFSAPTVKEVPYDEAGLRFRTYTIQVRLDARSPEESFSGRLWALDPSSGKPASSIMVYYRARLALAVSPSTLTLSSKAGEDFANGVVTILGRAPITELTVEPASDGVGLLEVAEDRARRTARFRQYTVRAKVGKLSEAKSYSLLVKSGAGRKTQVVPVILHGGSPR